MRAYLVSFVLLAACGPPPAPEEPASITPPIVRSSVPGQVRTRPLEVTRIAIRVDELPEPYATESARRAPVLVEPPADAALEVPEGFVVQRFAEGLANARWLRQAPDGSVLLAQSREGLVTRLVDADGDGVADEQSVFADEDSNALDIPFGLAFTDTHLYIGNQSGVRRYPWRPGLERLEGRGELVTRLPGGGYRQHWTRNVVLAPDGEHLFVSVGSRSNADPERPPRASVLTMRLDGSERRVFATGLRNPVGLDFHPVTGALYATVNERDRLGDGLVPDYFARVDDGAFYGWPYAYLTPELLDPRRMRGSRSERPELAARTRTPEVLFEAHSAALGLAFYRGDAFPERYRSGAFVAFRGSWNRSSGTGYKLVYVPFDASGEPLGHYEDFVRGFLVDPAGPTTWGRPVGVTCLTDGSLVFTDEPGGVVYRVSYRAGP